MTEALSYELILRICILSGNSYTNLLLCKGVYRLRPYKYFIGKFFTTHCFTQKQLLSYMIKNQLHYSLVSINKLVDKLQPDRNKTPRLYNINNIYMHKFPFYLFGSDMFYSYAVRGKNRFLFKTKKIKTDNLRRCHYILIKRNEKDRKSLFVFNKKRIVKDVNSVSYLKQLLIFPVDTDICNWKHNWRNIVALCY